MQVRAVKAMKVLVVTALFASASALAAAPKAGTADDLVDAYLKAQATLAADKTDGVAEAMKRVERSSAVVAKQDKKLAAALKDNAKAVGAATSLATAREAFKGLSTAMIEFAKNHYQGKRTLNVYNCGMAKADWVQESAAAAQNPYYGSEMLTCGEKVWPAAAGQNHMGGHSHGSH